MSALSGTYSKSRRSDTDDPQAPNVNWETDGPLSD